MPAPHLSSFYGPDALPAAQSTADATATVSASEKSSMVYHSGTRLSGLSWKKRKAARQSEGSIV